MTTLTEWQSLYDVAYADHRAMELLLDSDVPLAMACFHAQQAVEKYIKSVLRRYQVIFPFTHDLTILVALLSTDHAAIPISQDQARKLNPFAVSQRYDMPPEYPVTRQELKELVDLVAKWCKETIA